MTTQTEALKPCPFCGGEAYFDHDDNGWNWIECGSCGDSTNAKVSAMDDCKPLLLEQWNRRKAQPEQEPVAAAKKDEVFAASIEFIGTLTGMTPPPIEVAPPEVFKPFRDFTEKVCSILATPPQRKPLDIKTIKRIATYCGEHITDEDVIEITRRVEEEHKIKE